MASAILQGILQGLGSKYQESNQRKLTEESDRRKSISDLLTREAANQERLPESRQELLQHYLQLSQTPMEKKLPKDFESSILRSMSRVAPQLGQSWMGGETQREIPLQPSPISANLEGTKTLTPQPLPMTAPVPQVPMGATRSSYWSPSEQLQQQEKALDARYGAEYRARQKYAIPEAPTPPEDFTLGEGQSRYDSTGRLIAEGAPKPPAKDPAAKSLQADEVVYKDEFGGGQHAVFFNPDPATPGWYEKNPETGELIDVTQKVKGQYRLPPQPVGGLPSGTQSRVQALASQFDSNPVVRQYNEAVLRAANVSSILQSDWTGPGDMAIVFEFMRALDPTSVVRESEYATAAKTGNWFKGVFAKFNGFFNPEGGFLSEQVKKDFNDVLQGKIKQSTVQVKGIYKDFGRRIDKITGETGTGIDYLTDYTQFLGPEAQSQAPEPPGSYKAGDVVISNGKRYRVLGIDANGQLDAELIP